MWSVKDMFYANAEPIWILNHDKDDEEEENAGEEESSSAKEPKEEEYSATDGSNEAEEQRSSTLTASPYYPYYPNHASYPAYRPDPYYYAGQGAADSDEARRKERKVVMKVPICCGECEESIKIPLLEMRGVKHVHCDILKEKVTVITSTAAPVDILLACRKYFKESRMWTSED